jgi:hypothetical protein
VLHCRGRLLEVVLHDGSDTDGVGVCQVGLDVGELPDNLPSRAGAGDNNLAHVQAELFGVGLEEQHGLGELNDRRRVRGSRGQAVVDGHDVVAGVEHGIADDTEAFGASGSGVTAGFAADDPSAAVNVHVGGAWCAGVVVRDVDVEVAVGVLRAVLDVADAQITIVGDRPLTLGAGGLIGVAVPESALYRGRQWGWSDGRNDHADGQPGCHNGEDAGNAPHAPAYCSAGAGDTLPAAQGPRLSKAGERRNHGSTLSDDSRRVPSGDKPEELGEDTNRCSPYSQVGGHVSTGCGRQEGRADQRSRKKDPQQHPVIHVPELQQRNEDEDRPEADERPAHHPLRCCRLSWVKSY